MTPLDTATPQDGPTGQAAELAQRWRLAARDLSQLAKKATDDTVAYIARGRACQLDECAAAIEELLAGARQGGAA